MNIWLNKHIIVSRLIAALLTGCFLSCQLAQACPSDARSGVDTLAQRTLFTSDGGEHNARVLTAFLICSLMDFKKYSLTEVKKKLSVFRLDGEDLDITGGDEDGQIFVVLSDGLRLRFYNNRLRDLTLPEGYNVDSKWKAPTLNGYLTCELLRAGSPELTKQVIELGKSSSSRKAFEEYLRRRLRSPDGGDGQDKIGKVLAFIGEQYGWDLLDAVTTDEEFDIDALREMEQKLFALFNNEDLRGTPVYLAYLKSHCEGVADRVERYAKALGYGEKSIAFLRVAAAAHDLGKAITAGNLALHYSTKKWAEMTEKEQRTIQDHTRDSLLVLKEKGIKLPKEVILTVLSTHVVKQDLLAMVAVINDELGREVGLFPLADQFCAITEPRPYERDVDIEGWLSFKRSKGLEKDLEKIIRSDIEALGILLDKTEEDVPDGDKGVAGIKSKGDILRGFDTLLSDDLLRNNSFTRADFQSKRIKTGEKTYSYTTITTELEGMAALGILEPYKSEKPFKYTLSEKYRRAPPEFLEKVRSILEVLPANPDEEQLKKARSALEREMLVLNADRNVIDLLIHAMQCVAAEVKLKEDKVILYLDEDLPGLSVKKIQRELEKLIQALTGIENNNDDLLRFLKDKLEIRSGKGSEFEKKKGNVKGENIIAVTRKSNLKCFASIDGKGIITALDDTNAEALKKAYLPMLEITLFAVVKYLGWSEKTLRKAYMAIPNATPIEKLSEDKYRELFQRGDMKNFIIEIIPDAAVQTDDMAEAIERIREILVRA